MLQSADVFVAYLVGISVGWMSYPLVAAWAGRRSAAFHARLAAKGDNDEQA